MTLARPLLPRRVERDQVDPEALTSGHPVWSHAAFAVDPVGRERLNSPPSDGVRARFRAVSVSPVQVFVWSGETWRLTRQRSMLICRDSYGSHGTRTRDLRRDRPVRGNRLRYDRLPPGTACVADVRWSCCQERQRHDGSFDELDDRLRLIVDFML
jgi:hypothetical protein